MASSPTAAESAAPMEPIAPTFVPTTAGGRPAKVRQVLPNGKKTKGRVKIKMEYINNKLRRYTTFSKRKTGIMKKAHELATLTGTQVMLLVASETGHVYAFATTKLKPMLSSDQGKSLIQSCLSAEDEEPFPDGGAGLKTEFTFEPSGVPGTLGSMVPASPSNAPTSNRKRKFQRPRTEEGDGTNALLSGFAPTMVPGGGGGGGSSLDALMGQFGSTPSCAAALAEEEVEEEDEDDEEDDDDEGEEDVASGEQSDDAEADPSPPPPPPTDGGFDSSLAALGLDINGAMQMFMANFMAANGAGNLVPNNNNNNREEMAAPLAKRPKKASPIKLPRWTAPPLKAEPATPSASASDALYAQKTLKEAMKAAADQRQRNQQQQQRKKAAVVGSATGSTCSSSPSNHLKHQQQQLNAAALIPLMLQGLVGSAASTPSLIKNSSQPPRTNQPNGAGTCTPNSTPTPSSSSSSNPNSVIYQLPQGVVYAPNSSTALASAAGSLSASSSADSRSATPISSSGCNSGSSNAAMAAVNLLLGGNTHQSLGNLTVQQLFANAALAQLAQHVQNGDAGSSSHSGNGYKGSV